MAAVVGGWEDRPTLLHAAPRHRVLPDKVIPGFPVVVLDYKTQQGQLGHQDLEAQRLPPVWIKPWGRAEERGSEGSDLAGSLL